MHRRSVWPKLATLRGDGARWWWWLPKDASEHPGTKQRERVFETIVRNSNVNESQVKFSSTAF
jgi:hypothetical protein